MGFAANCESRFEYAKRLIATLAYLVVHQGDAAGLIVVGEKTIHELPARRNPAHFQNLLEILDQAKPNGETGLMPALHEIAEKTKRRALVAVTTA